MKVIAMSIKKQSPLGKYLLLILVVLIFNFPAVIAAQPSPTIEWQRCLGGSLYEYPNRVITTNDGGYLVIGHTASNDGDVYNAPRIFYTGWVVHLDQFGSTLWTRCLNLDDVNHITDVIQTSDSGYLLVGRTRSRYVDSSRTHGRWDALIVKLNKNGNVRWQRSYGGSKDDYASSIVESSLEGGGYIFVGATSSVDGDVLGHHNSPDTSRSGYYDSTDAWVVAISYNGDLQWQKCLGGDSADFAHTIIKTPDGNYAFLGWTNSTNGDVIDRHSTDGYYGNQWLVKMNTTGSIIWQKFLKGGAGYGLGWYGGVGGGYGGYGGGGVHSHLLMLQTVE